VAEFTIGVEEEFHLLDAVTYELRTAAPDVLAELGSRLTDGVEPELLRTQVEIQTPVCTTLSEVRTHLTGLRREVATNAAKVGIRIAASGAWPGTTPPVPPTEQERYEQIADRFGPTAREQTVCGAHVHVHIGDRDLRMAVIRRARPWLAALLALSANSPYWRGADTGYASYRSQVWARWPMAGPPPVLRSAQEYDDLVAALLATGVMHDEGMLYWDLREAKRFGTVEFRVGDVGTRVDDTLLLAALARALVVTSTAEQSGDPIADVSPELIRVAHWRAARYGLDGELVDPATGRPAPADDVVGHLIEHVRPALVEHGDAAFVDGAVEAMLAGDTGVARQHAAFRRAGEIRDVVRMLADQTEGDGG